VSFVSGSKSDGSREASSFPTGLRQMRHALLPSSTSRATHLARLLARYRPRRRWDSPSIAMIGKSRPSWRRCGRWRARDIRTLMDRRRITSRAAAWPKHSSGRSSGTTWTALNCRTPKPCWLRSTAGSGLQHPGAALGARHAEPARLSRGDTADGGWRRDHVTGDAAFGSDARSSGRPLSGDPPKIGVWVDPCEQL